MSLVANQPGTAGRYVAMICWVSTAATAAVSGTPSATSAPESPMADTNVFPPGTGISDAIVPITMFATRSGQ